MIQPKRKSVIQKGTMYSYDPKTFVKIENFYEAATAEELLANIKPLEYEGRKFIFVDTETHGHFPTNHSVPDGVVRRWVGKGKQSKPQDYPFCISICDGVNAYTLYDTVDNDFKELKKLAPLLEDPTVEKVIHNAKFDMTILCNASIKIVGKIHDTIIMAKLTNENRFSFALMDLATNVGGVVQFEYMVDSYKKQYKISDYRDVPKELMTMYANADVWNLYKVFISEYPKLVAEQLELLYENELKVMMAFWAMERYGMAVDITYEKELKDELQSLADAAERSVYDYAGKIFNLNSGKQLYEVMLDKGVNRDIIKMSDKGNPVLDKDALNKLANVHGVEIVSKILEFRKYEKLLTTYAVGIYDQMDSNSDVHCSINQTEATTGRSSITKPALQTLPKKDRRIRRAFVPRDEFELAFMDLDQVFRRLCV